VANRSSFVSAHNVALGEQEGEAEMFQHTDHSPSSSLLHSSRTSHSLYPFTKREALIKVHMAQLDKFLDESGIALHPGILIKLDVQGYEDRVIRGAQRTFASAKACISEVNFDNLFEGQCSFKDVWILLDRLGYRYSGNLNQTCADDGHMVFADAMFVRYSRNV